MTPGVDRPPEDSALSRRNILLGGTTIAAASALAAPGSVDDGAGTAAGAGDRGGPTAEHPRHLRRRHRPDQHQRLLARPDGLPHAEHRPHRQGRHDVHRLLRRAELHGGAVVLHHRPGDAAHRPLQGRAAGRRPSACSAEDITIAEALKPLGYATGQFGKNHLGDRNEFLPTVHGFDEFFGNLYHLNAEEEPEQPDYPQGPAIPRQVRPARRAQDARPPTRDDPTVDPRFGKVGRQTIEDTGPLTKKRMETIDDETSRRGDRLHPAPGQGQQAVLLLVQQHAHAPPHACAAGASRASSGVSEYADGMIEHDGHVGKLLKALDDLGIANDTIVVYTTDNGPHMNSWPDGGMTPFRSEKNTNWEGAFRVPAMIRWPGQIKPGAVSNEIVCGARLVPDAARGRRRRRTSRRSCSRAGRPAGKHLQGAPRRLQPAALPDRASRTSRRARSSSTSTTTASSWRCATRTGRWSSASSGSRARCRSGPSRSSCLRVPKMFNLRMDPYERADITSNTYYDWIDPPRVPGGAGAGRGGAVPGDVQGVPAAPEAGELQRRAGHGHDRTARGRPSCRWHQGDPVRATVAKWSPCGPGMRS